MEEKIKVSILLSVFNEKLPWVKSSVESILKQSYKHYEFIIILDNPENIETWEYICEVAEKNSKVRCVKNDMNIGLVKSMNKGIEIARGQYIARMDADDIASENRILKQVEFLEQNQEVMLVGCDVSKINEDGSIISYRSRIVNGSKLINRLIKYRNLFYHPTFMFRRKAIDIVGGYREIPYAEDYDLICRLASGGHCLANLEEPLLQYRIRKNSITNTHRLKQKAMTLYVQRLYNNLLRNKTDIHSSKLLESYLRSDRGIDKLRISILFHGKHLWYKLNKLLYILLKGMRKLHRRHRR